RDSRYLECFPTTKSEIVVPIMSGGKVLGEIDIDSGIFDAFSSLDREFLEAVATMLAPTITSLGIR
ncbi:MAG TPA: GAF domain-containing protein, partial [Nitrososphaerales archaeon]|nr:GAF domain-containing protein [Nitrososphaerales archaeon]